METPVTNSKYCISCEKRKSLSEFNKKQHEKFVYESECKECQKEKMLNDEESPKRQSTQTKKRNTKNLLPSRQQISDFPEKTEQNKTRRKIKF